MEALLKTQLGFMLYVKYFVRLTVLVPMPFLSMKGRVFASAHFNQIASSKIALVPISVVNDIPTFWMHNGSMY